MIFQQRLKCEVLLPISLPGNVRVKRSLAQTAGYVPQFI